MQSSPSSGNGPRQLSSPSFSCSNEHSYGRIAADPGGRQSWRRSLSTDAIIQRGKAAAASDASRGVSLLGNLVMLVMVATVLSIAAVTIHQEEQLAPRERQALQQQR